MKSARPGPLVHVRPNPKKIRIGAPIAVFTCFQCGEVRPYGAFEEAHYTCKAGVAYHHPHCRECVSRNAAEWFKHQLITRQAMNFIHHLCIKARHGARARDMVFALTKVDVAGMYIRQSGLCAITGLEMTFENGTQPGVIDPGQRPRMSVSIDRIDSRYNYTLDNVHLVCRIINMMKQDLTMEEFELWCSAVAIAGMKKSKATAA